MLLEDGAWFAGTAPLPFESSFGEVVFTTNLSGYQEVFTDPSYLGQLVTMTAPMIGNYGINPDDIESDRPRVAGVVVRELSRVPFNWRATGTLLDVMVSSLKKQGQSVDADELEKLREQVAGDYERQTDVRYAAARGWVDKIIDPAHTREVLIQSLEIVTRSADEEPFRVGVYQV